MLISLIIPVYNSEEFLEKLLNNLIKQTYKQIEIILINDGSTDQSLALCEKFQNKDNRIKICTQENSGVSVARNRGIEIARGDYITFIDSDDNVSENYVEILVNNMEKDYLVKNNYKKELDNRIYNKLEYLEEILSGKTLGVCWGYLFDRKKIGDLRFDVNTLYMEDTIFLVQYLLKNSKVKVIDKDLYYHTPNENSLTRNKKNIEEKINGYIYSIDKIEKLINLDNVYIKKALKQKKIKIIESEFAKISSKEEINKILENENVKAIKKYKNVPIEYKIFCLLLKKSNVDKLYRYVVIRRKIKNIVKGR